MTRVLRLLRFELNVGDLARATHFYTEALGFEQVAGAQTTLRRGGQTLVLKTVDPPGASYPAHAAANDQVFQHLALPVSDMHAAYARLAPFAPAAISQNGPQLLPARSGGVVAYKFRDPDGHPLELIQFPSRHADGIDHSAIAVLDTARSLAFYQGQLGLRVAARQVNTGAEQDALDGLSGVSVDVVALEPAQAVPHIELLGYRMPAGRPTPLLRADDIAATRLVLACDLPPGTPPALVHDPDGHALLLTPA